mmetsp:Transcript_2811/g.11641  ORF Transcript_2811/g.11641 Transcript_2811/m.11641 type:complete len:288 (+) Transcript_2811:1-864(+)
MMIVSLLVYLLRARGGVAARGRARRRTTRPDEPRVARVARRRRDRKRKMKSHSSRRAKKRARLEFRPLSSRIVARARPLVSYARTPVPTLPKSPPSPSSAHRFFAGFKPEGDSGGDLFLGTTTAPARCTGVEGPSVFVRRYRVPQALQSIGLDAGPRRHCGESAAPQWSHGPPGLTYAAWCCGCGLCSGSTSSNSASSFALAPLSVSSASSSLVSSGSLRIRSSSSRNSASDAPGPYSSRRTSVYHCLVEGGYPTCGSYSRIAGFAATRSEGGTTGTFGGCAARPIL